LPSSSVRGGYVNSGVDAAPEGRDCSRLSTARILFTSGEGITAAAYATEVFPCCETPLQDTDFACIKRGISFCSKSSEQSENRQSSQNGSIAAVLDGSRHKDSIISTICLNCRRLDHEKASCRSRRRTYLHSSCCIASSGELMAPATAACAVSSAGSLPLGACWRGVFS
jgi:hypothetical protein